MVADFSTRLRELRAHQGLRQKDLADITRLVETHPELKERLPLEIRSEVE